MKVEEVLSFGFCKVAAAIPSVRVADCAYNVDEMLKWADKAEREGVQIMTFPELGLTAYTCQDLFLQERLLRDAEEWLKVLLQATCSFDVVMIVGLPIALNGQTLNAAAVLHQGEIKGVVPKTFLPNYKEFYERRWFTSARSLKQREVTLCGKTVPLGTDLLFEAGSVTFGIEICEDLWSVTPPSERLALQGADIIFNLSADTESLGKYQYLTQLVAQQSARCLAGYVFASCGFGESTQDVVFAGNGFIYENGEELARSQRFLLEGQLISSEIDVEKLRSERRLNTTFSGAIGESTYDAPRRILCGAVKKKEYPLSRVINPHPFMPTGKALDERCEEIFEIQVSGLAKRFVHTHCRSAVIGISGGLDSTLALLVAVRTFDKLGKDRKDILAVTMPGFGTTDRTYTNAINLMKQLRVSTREISIKEACNQHFADIRHNPTIHDVTYENSQARERTQILMDLCNQVNGLVIGTGDLSELALGWATYNGDHMSMYGVNGSVPKTLVKHLVHWVAMRGGLSELARETLLDIVDTPISPELIPADERGRIKQKTEDLVGPYELHDFFLYQILRFGFTPHKVYFLACQAFGTTYEKKTIKKWLHTFYYRFFQQQFKRSCLPDGPKVGSVTLSPRGDWRMPTDAVSKSWLLEVDAIVLD